MCESTPTSTIYSTSASLVFNTITTSSAVVVTPSAVTSTQTLSTCIGGNGVVAIADGIVKATSQIQVTSKEDVQPQPTIVPAPTTQAVQPTSTSMPAFAPAEAFVQDVGTVTTSDNGGSESSGLKNLAGLIATGGGTSISVSDTGIPALTATATARVSTTTSQSSASVSSAGKEVPAASQIPSAEGGGRKAVQNASSRTTFTPTVTSISRGGTQTTSTESFFGPVAAVGEGAERVIDSSTTLPFTGTRSTAPSSSVRFSASTISSLSQSHSSQAAHVAPFPGDRSSPDASPSSRLTVIGNSSRATSVTPTHPVSVESGVAGDAVVAVGQGSGRVRQSITTTSHTPTSITQATSTARSSASDSNDITSPKAIAPSHKSSSTSSTSGSVTISSSTQSVLSTSTSTGIIASTNTVSTEAGGVLAIAQGEGRLDASTAGSHSRADIHTAGSLTTPSQASANSQNHGEVQATRSTSTVPAMETQNGNGGKAKSDPATTSITTSVRTRGTEFTSQSRENGQSKPSSLVISSGPTAAGHSDDPSVAQQKQVKDRPISSTVSGVDQAVVKASLKASSVKGEISPMSVSRTGDDAWISSASTNQQRVAAKSTTQGISEISATPASKPASEQPAKTKTPVKTQAVATDSPQTSPSPAAHSLRSRRATNHRRARGDENDNCQNWSTYYSTVVSTPDAYTSWFTGYVTSTSTSYVQIPISTLYQSCDAVSTTAPPAQATDTAAAVVTSSADPVMTSTRAGKDLLSGFLQHVTSTTIAQVMPASEDSPGITSSTAIQPQASSAKQQTTIVKQVTSADGLINTVTTAVPIDQTTSAQAFDDKLPVSTDGPIAPATSGGAASISASTTSPPTNGIGAASGATSIQPGSTLKDGTNSLAPANAATSRSDPKASSSTHTTSPTGTSQPDNKPASSNKGISAGAAIGGIVALLLFIAGVLFVVRWWLRRKRTKRTNELRSSWFYGGDVDGPGDEVVPSAVFGTSNEKRQSEQPQSRFSAPSTHTPNRLSRVVPAFLALPIKHIRQGSGRFPGYLNDLRKSIQPSPRTPNTAFIPTNANAWAQTNPYADLSPPIVPIPVRTPRDALDGDTRHISTLSPTNDYTHTPDYGTPPPSKTYFSSDAPPRLELGDTGRMSITKLDWGHSYTSSISSLSSTSTHSHDNSMSSPIAVVSAATRSNPHLTPHVIVTAPTESYYSQPETLHSMYSQGDLSEMPIGQAVTAPGRVSPFEIRPSSSTYSYSFPMPPLSQADSTASIHFPQPSIQGRNLTQSGQYQGPSQSIPELPPISGMGEHQGHDSSLFEYADYASRHGSMATTRSREDGRDWYDRAMWEVQGQDMPLESVYGGVQQGQGQNRKSVKSVRWGDEEPEPRVFQLARAL